MSLKPSTASGRNQYGLDIPTNDYQDRTTTFAASKNGTGSSLGLKRNSQAQAAATTVSGGNINRELIRKGASGINRSLEVRSNNERSQSRQSNQKRVLHTNTPAFIVGGETIPNRDSRIKPDQGRNFLNQLPVRYEQDKLRNVISRSLRKVANQNKQIFAGISQVYTGVDKDSNFKNKDYDFMKQLRADNSANREQMTIKLTQKLLENKRKGAKQNLEEEAMKISHKMSITIDKKGKKDAGGQESEAEEDERDRRIADQGPPGFYENDVERYFSKFDKSINERAEYKKSMQDSLKFSSSEWNLNVEHQGGSFGHRSCKQSTTLPNGTRQPLRQSGPVVKQGLTQTNQTYLKQVRKQRPLSRGSTRAATVLDFDWYGNSADIDHLTKKRPDTSASRLRFELGLRQYASKNKFKAPHPWVFNPNEAPLKEVVPISQDLLDKGGYEQNVHYSSVVRIDPRVDPRGKLPDHLSLPSYSDKFIAQQDPNLLRQLQQGQTGRKKIGLNELKWTVSLRNQLKEQIPQNNYKTATQGSPKESQKSGKKYSSLRNSSLKDLPPRSQTAMKLR